MIKFKYRREMKKSLLILFIIIFTVSVILIDVGCKKAAESATNKTAVQENTTDETTTDDAVTDETTEDESTQNTEVDSSIELEAEEHLVDYSINVNDEVIAIRDWYDDIDLYKILGDPLSEDIQKLESADTLSSSFIKTLKYEGLEIGLFSPSDNGITFWILDIKVYSNLYSTFKGIKVGDSLETLKNRYPLITKILDGRTDDNNYAYEIADRERYLYQQFEVESGIIQQIHIFHLIP